MTTDYTPVDCAQHSAYELAVLQRRPLRLTWHDEQGLTHSDTLTPEDVRTRDHAEYLLLRRADGQPLEVRLDRILNSEPL